MKSLGIQGKLCALFMSGIVIFSAAICLMVYTVFSSFQMREVTQFRQHETRDMEEILRENVLMAYNILESNYQRATDKSFLEKEYGPRLITIIDVAESIIQENIKQVASAEFTLAEAQENAKKSIAMIRYDNG
ncbi:MAG: cache domain-containing protein, partial [Proteobacteria bacterium]|nr:cache domain-containing protein [Pseudomonadota bacterium]